MRRGVSVVQERDQESAAEEPRFAAVRCRTAAPSVGGGDEEEGRGGEEGGGSRLGPTGRYSRGRKGVADKRTESGGR